DGIGRRSVTRDRQRLTSAAAPVDLPPLTRPTGLRHPGGATERVEGRRIPPYLADRSLADRFEYHPRKRFRSMARQHLARRGDVQEATPPPAHAGLRPAAVIIRYDMIDGDAAPQALPRPLDRLEGGAHLLRRRHQGGAIANSPAVILHVRHLDPLRQQIDRHRQQVLQGRQILTMDHEVHGQRQTAHPDSLGRSLLLRQCAAIAGDTVSAGWFAVLEAYLYVVEPGACEPLHPLFRQQHGRCDQVRVEPSIPRGGDDLIEGGPCHGLTAGKVHLQRADVRDLPHHPDPLGRRELGLGPLQLDRIRAIGTLQWATVGKLGQYRQWRVDHVTTTPFSARSLRRAVTSFSTTWRCSWNAAARSSAIAPTVAVPSHRLMISKAISSGTKRRSGARTIHFWRVGSNRVRTPRARRGTEHSSTAVTEPPERRHPAADERAPHRRDKGRRAEPTEDRS